MYRDADLIFENDIGDAVLLIEVKAQRGDDIGRGWLLENVSDAPVTAEWIMLVDLDHIRLYRRGGSLDQPVVQSSTRCVLSWYESEFDTMRLSERYLRTLVELWLSDTTEHWKHETAPGEEALDEAGLLDMLRHARVRPEVDLDAVGLL